MPLPTTSDLYHPVDVADFLSQTIAYMDTLDWIERYSWFGYFVGFSNRRVSEPSTDS